MGDLDHIARSAPFYFRARPENFEAVISAAHVGIGWNDLIATGTVGQDGVFGASSRIKARKNMTVAIEGAYQR